jgi:hypothetical protein
MPQNATVHRSSAVVLVLALAIAVAETGSQNPANREPVNPEALVLADFSKRIKAYMDVRNDVEKGAAEQKETSDPAKIRGAQVKLAERVRAARKDARPGDIFTPEIRAAFRRLMYPETKGAEGRETKAEMKEDAPTAVPLKVNANYPEGRPLPTVPANLLASLPQLPEALEYRIVDKHLILRDVDANVIVDYIPNAIR